MSTITLGKTGITIEKNGFGCLPIQRISKEEAAKLLRTIDPDCLPMGAGGCNICRKCSYPDEPCRFPDKAFTSMEAYGLYVAAECKKAGLEYNYGPNTLTYSSCILYND